ncbi:MAG: AraC family transcriptional regulator [Pseudomonadota bacterium]
MDLLSSILDQMKLAGTLYFRTEFTAPWGVEVPRFKNVSRFHFVHRGRATVRIEGSDSAVSLDQGDLIIITRGASHILADDPDTPAETVDEIVTRSGFKGVGALVYGSHDAGHETQLICGHFAFDPEANHPLLDALPAFILIRQDAVLSDQWLDSTLRGIAAEAGRGSPGGDLIAHKLSEIIFAQAVRSHLRSEGQERSVLAAFANPAICRVLETLHKNASQNWTLEEMAQIAGMSRTVFAERFSRSMSMTPMAYLTHWRMQLARRYLRETEMAVIEVAEQSGYSSEASFSRVFKKQFGTPPGLYRRRMRTEMTGA